MKYLAIEPSVGGRFERLKAAALASDSFARVEAEVLARLGDPGPRTRKGYNVSGGVASIDIKGVLTPEPDILAMIFEGGNTTYADIIAGIASADADPKVKSIQFDIDSPGGAVAGLWGAADAIAKAKKPTRALVNGWAASAAYTLASQAGALILSGPMDQVGSVGIVQTHFLDPGRVDITSSAAPNKRPAVGTEEGNAVVRAELDDLHAPLVAKIGEGRSRATGQEITADFINENFGRGGMVIAEKAIAAKMADGMEVEAGKSPGTRAIKQEGKQMDKTFEEGLAQGTGQGAAQEQERVLALLALGQKAGAMDLATAAIKDGKSVADMAVAFTEAAAAKAQQKTIATEEPPPVPPVVPTEGTGGENNEDPKAKVAALVCAGLGFTPKA